MPDDDLPRLAYETYRKLAGGLPFHQLTPEQRTAWHDVVDVIFESILDDELDDE